MFGREAETFEKYKLRDQFLILKITKMGSAWALWTILDFRNEAKVPNVTRVSDFNRKERLKNVGLLHQNGEGQVIS